VIIDQANTKNVPDLIAGIDVNNHLWKGVYSGNACNALITSDWSWTDLSTSALTGGASYGPSLAVTGSGLGTTVLASDQAGNCNTDGDSYIQRLLNTGALQAVTTTGNTLCSRFVQGDTSGNTYTLQDDGEIWTFTFYPSVSLGTQRASVTGATSFADAGDATGFAAVTGTIGFGGTISVGANKSTLYVGNYGDSNTVNVKFDTAFPCTNSSGDVYIDNVVIDQRGKSLYFSCGNPTAEDVEVYYITSSALCTATGGSGSPCSCTGHSGCVSL
jgi:hypothetical protein